MNLTETVAYEPAPVKTIDEVISELNSIIENALQTNNAAGYFAVLYKKVTVKVKEGIENHFFDDCVRMEKLDIVFARRYIDAYFCWQKNEVVAQSWEKAFISLKNKNMLVLQHLLMGMNAHINLDLGIAAAEISTKENIHLLKNDFNKINDILSSLVEEVQFGLSTIWPGLKWLLSKSGKLDNYLVDFSMEIARDGAWNFATEIVQYKDKDWLGQIKIRDLKVAEKTKIITHPGKWIQFLLWFIRLGEKGSVSEKMNRLNLITKENTALKTE